MSTSQSLFQLALWKTHFLWPCGKKKSKLWFIVVCTLIDNEYASLFSLTFFSYCFCMLREVSKVFERNVWRVQVVHLRNAACAVSSPSRCFQLSTKLDKRRIFFPYLWFCGKKTNPMHIRFVKSRSQVAWGNRPLSIYQYSNMALRLSGQTSTLCCFLCIQVSFGNWGTNETWKICNFVPK